MPKQAGQDHLLAAVDQIGVLLLGGVTGVEVDLLPLPLRSVPVERPGEPWGVRPLGRGLSAWLSPHRAGRFHFLDALAQTGALLVVGVTGIEVNLL
ncbi:hypothetical protein, partial [Actinoplanes awajinensis]|uniref:hypothetical protein n=1 Tax=Actinoplanes awajinensis TaxID=135946 RepID=UPI001E4E53F7